MIPVGADGTELVVADRTYCAESAPDPTMLKAELAARSSVVPPLSRPIGPATCSLTGIDEDSTQTPIVQPQSDDCGFDQSSARLSTIDQAGTYFPSPVDAAVSSELDDAVGLDAPVPTVVPMPIDDFVSTFRKPLSQAILSSPATTQDHLVGEGARR
jgi:hypothetical protein